MQDKMKLREEIDLFLQILHTDEDFISIYEILSWCEQTKLAFYAAKLIHEDRIDPYSYACSCSEPHQTDAQLDLLTQLNQCRDSTVEDSNTHASDFYRSPKPPIKPSPISKKTIRLQDIT